MLITAALRADHAFERSAFAAAPGACVSNTVGLDIVVKGRQVVTPQYEHIKLSVRHCSSAYRYSLADIISTLSNLQLCIILRLHSRIVITRITVT